MLDIDLSKEEATELSKRDAAEASKIVMSKLNIDLSKLEEKDREALKRSQDYVTQAIQAEREGKTGKSAELLERSKGEYTDKIKQALMEVEQMKNKNFNDPQMKAVGHLQAIETKLNDIATKLPGNPEEFVGPLQ